MQSTNSNNINQNTNNKKLLTPEEVADQLLISRATVYRLITSRKIQFYKIGGGLRFRQEEVDRFIEENMIEPIR